MAVIDDVGHSEEPGNQSTPATEEMGVIFKDVTDNSVADVDEDTEMGAEDLRRFTVIQYTAMNTRPLFG